MSLDHHELKRKLISLLTPALCSELERLNKIPWEHHYAFVVYCADLSDMGHASSSEESVEANLDHEPGARWFAYAWQRMGGFDEICDFLRQWLDQWYDDEKDWDWDAEVLDAVVVCIKAAKAEANLDGDHFADEMLWGLQYSDPSENQVTQMLNMSEQVNSPQIHNEFSEACRTILGG